MKKRADELAKERDNPISQCSRCAKAVPLANTMVTEFGHMCHACYANVNG